jgi:hypothetical protein
VTGGPASSGPAAASGSTTSRRGSAEHRKSPNIILRIQRKGAPLVNLYVGRRVEWPLESQ